MITGSGRLSVAELASHRPTNHSQQQSTSPRPAPPQANGRFAAAVAIIGAWAGWGSIAREEKWGSSSSSEYESGCGPYRYHHHSTAATTTPHTPKHCLAELHASTHHVHTQPHAQGLPAFESIDRCLSAMEAGAGSSGYCCC